MLVFIYFSLSEIDGMNAIFQSTEDDTVGIRFRLYPIFMNGQLRFSWLQFSFDSEESEAILAAQQLMRLSTINRELALIKTNYSCIRFSTALTSIQAEGVSLSVAIEKFLAVGAQLDRVQHAAVYQKI